MGIYNFDSTLDHKTNGSFRWEQVNGRNDIIGMGTADLDYFCPPCVKEATRHIWEENTFNYRMRPDSYFNAVIGWYKRHFDLDIKREWLFSVPGTLASIRLAVGCFAEKGDGVIVQMPCFGPIQTSIKLSGFKMVENPMKLIDGHYELDLEDFEKKVKDEKPKVFLMVNPHNPTGKLFSKEDLAELVRICAENGVKIVSDEVHSIIVPGEKKFTPILAVNDAAKDISIQVVSMSKGYNLMSLPHAIVTIPNEELRKAYADTISAHSFGYATNSYAITAAESVMNDADEWLKEVTQYIRENGDYAIEYCEKYIPKLKPIRPEGGFLLWIDCSRLNIPKEEVAEWFVEHAGITLDNGLEFGEEGAGFIRLNIAVTREVLKQAMERLREACK